MSYTMLNTLQITSRSTLKAIRIYNLLMCPFFSYYFLIKTFEEISTQHIRVQRGKYIRHTKNYNLRCQNV